MKINNIILINRDMKREFRFKELTENGQCHLSSISGMAIHINIDLPHLLNELNTVNGAWSFKK